MVCCCPPPLPDEPPPLYYTDSAFRDRCPRCGGRRP